MQSNEICVLLPADGPVRLGWAAEELLARVGVPYRLISAPAEAAGGVVLAIECPLPRGRGGLELGGKDAVDGMDFARGLADDTARGLVESIGENQSALRVDLADLFEDWLGRREEYNPDKWDHANRIRMECHGLRTAGLSQAPLAELLGDLVYGVLAETANCCDMAFPERRTPWPGGAKFACQLSHDVDFIGGRYQIWRRYLAWSLRYLRDRLAGRSSAAQHLARIRRWWTEPGDPQYCIPALIDVEGRHGATSTFYLFCNRSASTRGQMQSRMYRIQDKLPREAVSLIVRNGWEAGVHGTYPTNTDERVFAEHRQRLEQIAGEQIVGIRQHYLHLQVPETWRAQQRAGFTYDATLGWNFDVSLRAATCRPFQIWDCREQAPMGLYELPLTHQDSALATLFGEPEHWLAGLSGLMDRIEAVRGVGSVLLHPDHMDSVEFPGQAEFYEQLLIMLERRGAFVRSGKEIIAAEAAYRRLLKTT